MWEASLSSVAVDDDFSLAAVGDPAKLINAVNLNCERILEEFDKAAVGLNRTFAAIWMNGNWEQFSFIKKVDLEKDGLY